MKKHIILSVAVLALAAAACTTQDDIYKEYVVAGGRIYPAKAVNVVLVGVLSRFMPFPEETWLQAIEETVPPKFLELNKKAFRLGRES